MHYHQPVAQHRLCVGPRTHRAHQGPSPRQQKRWGLAQWVRPARLRAVRGPGTAPGAAPTRAAPSPPGRGGCWGRQASPAQRPADHRPGPTDPAADSPARWCGRAAGIRSARLRLAQPAHWHGGAQNQRHGPHVQAHEWALRGGRQNAAPGAPGPAWAPMPGPVAGRPARPRAMRANRHAGAWQCTHAGGAVAKAGAWQMKGGEISAEKTGQRGAAAARYFTGTASTRR